MAKPNSKKLTYHLKDCFITEDYLYDSFQLRKATLLFFSITKGYPIILFNYKSYLIILFNYEKLSYYSFHLHERLIFSFLLFFLLSFYFTGKTKWACCYNQTKLSVFFGGLNPYSLNGIKADDIAEWLSARFVYRFKHVKKDQEWG